MELIRIEPRGTQLDHPLEPVGEEPHEAPLTGIFHRVRRYKLLLASIVAASTVASIVFVETATPRYTAQAVVTIERDKKDPLAGDKSVRDRDEAPESALVWGEVTRIQSWTLVDHVIERLHLMSDPEIDPGAGAGQSLLDPWSVLSALGLDRLAGLFNRSPAETSPGAAGQVPGSEGPPTADGAQINQRRLEAIRRFQWRLDVQPDRLSSLINIRFTSADPQKAARVVNAIAQDYLEGQVSQKYDATQRAIDWLTGTVARLHTAMVTSDSALEAYRVKAQLIESHGVSVNGQQVSEMNSQLTVAQGAEAAAAARLRQIEALQHGPGVQSAPEVLASPVIQHLKEQKAELNQRLTELEHRYGDRYPEVAKIRAELGQIESSIEAEVHAIVQSVRSEVDTAHARATVLQRHLGDLQGASASQDQSEVRLRELQRETDANKAVYESFLLRLKEMTTKLAVQRPDATIVSAAVVPLTPSFPNKLLIPALAFLGSIVVGFIVVLLVDLHRTSFDNIQQIERATSLRALGLVPQVDVTRQALGGLSMVRKAGAIYAEAIRTIRANLLSANGGDYPKSVLITSAIPGEGKSTLAVSLARMSAKCGQRVVLIDCDLGRPTLHARMGTPKASGLVDVLERGLAPAQALRADKATSMQYMVTGLPPDHPGDLLGSAGMQRLLWQLGHDYDMVVLDSSPVLALSDTGQLGRLVDQCVVVVEWRRTPAKAVATALKRLKEMQVQVAGFVLSRVDIREYAKLDSSGLRYCLDYYHGRYAHNVRRRPA